MINDFLRLRSNARFISIAKHETAFCDIRKQHKLSTLCRCKLCIHIKASTFFSRDPDIRNRRVLAAQMQKASLITKFIIQIVSLDL